MPTLEGNLETLEQFLELKQDWNGYNADPFNPKLIEICKEIVKKLEPQPDIFPTARDSVQFEYEMDNGKYLEFEIFENRTEVFEEDETGKNSENLIGHEANDFLPFIQSFFNK